MMRALTVYQPYVAGVLHGDAWCTPLTLGLRVKDQDFSEAFVIAVNAICGTRITSRRDERGYWLVRARNKSGRFDSLKGYAPTNNDELGAWLRGLFDSDGNAQLLPLPRKGPNSYHRRIAFYSTDPDTIIKTCDYLLRLNIPHGLRETKNHNSHKGSKVVREVMIRRQEGFTRFACAVGSSIARKRNTIAAIVSTYQPPGWQARNWSKAVAARWPR